MPENLTKLPDSQDIWIFLGCFFHVQHSLQSATHSLASSFWPRQKTRSWTLQDIVPIAKYTEPSFSKNRCNGNLRDSWVAAKTKLLYWVSVFWNVFIFMESPQTLEISEIQLKLPLLIEKRFSCLHNAGYLFFQYFYVHHFCPIFYLFRFTDCFVHPWLPLHQLPLVCKKHSFPVSCFDNAEMNACTLLCLGSTPERQSARGNSCAALGFTLISDWPKPSFSSYVAIIPWGSTNFFMRIRNDRHKA